MLNAARAGDHKDQPNVSTSSLATRAYVELRDELWQLEEKIRQQETTDQAVANRLKNKAELCERISIYYRSPHYQIKHSATLQTHQYIFTKLRLLDADIGSLTAKAQRAKENYHAAVHTREINTGILTLANEHWKELQPKLAQLPNNVKYLEQKAKLEERFAKLGVKPGTPAIPPVAPPAVVPLSNAEISDQFKPIVTGIQKLKKDLHETLFFVFTQSPEVYNPDETFSTEKEPSPSLALVNRDAKGSATKSTLAAGSGGASAVATSDTKGIAATASKVGIFSAAAGDDKHVPSAELKLIQDTLAVIGLITASEITKLNPKFPADEKTLASVNFAALEAELKTDATTLQEQTLILSVRTQFEKLKLRLNSSASIAEKAEWFGCTLGAMQYFIHINKNDVNIKALLELNQQWKAHYKKPGLLEYIEKCFPSASSSAAAIPAPK